MSSSGISGALGYLTDELLVEYLRRCKEAVRGRWLD